jgi:hypothetical protein
MSDELAPDPLARALRAGRVRLACLGAGRGQCDLDDDRQHRRHGVRRAWGENAAYYSVMLVRELLATRSLARALRDLALEFGLAEALDSGVIRPACIYVATQAAADLSLGVFIGKLAADVAFYIPTIFAYELRRYFEPARRATTGANASMTRSKIIT